ncbi:hypothetical protein [Massilia niastensis]|uniref:hypothetical protein n=1 Tax=Massilia niastensis TaxID=544911 RepID=UPI00037F76B3|nr:hypothetical protein [Massilia niastensis]
MDYEQFVETSKSLVFGAINGVGLLAAIPILGACMLAFGDPESEGLSTLMLVTHLAYPVLSALALTSHENRYLGAVGLSLLMSYWMAASAACGVSIYC